MKVSSHYNYHHVQPKKKSNNKSPALVKALETRCSKTVAPPFITFAVNWIPGGIQFWKQGRWGRKGTAQAIRILYSSLSQTFGCAVELHVHTNYDHNPIKTLLDNDVYSSIGTKMNGLEFHPLNKTAWKHNPYLNKKYVSKPSKWLALSRSKLETIELHLDDNPNYLPVWVDLDTIIFDKSAVLISQKDNEQPRQQPWVYGYHHNQRNICYGDIFCIDQQTIDDIRKLENEIISSVKKDGGDDSTKLLPTLDLQGYFGMMLETNASRFVIMQEQYPNFSFGFDCSENGNHPYPDSVKDRIRFNNNQNRITCPNPRLPNKDDNSNNDVPVGAMSFTAPSYREFFLLGDSGNHESSAFDILEDQDAGKWLKNYIFGDG